MTGSVMGDSILVAARDRWQDVGKAVKELPAPHKALTRHTPQTPLPHAPTGY